MPISSLSELTQVLEEERNRKDKAVGILQTYRRIVLPQLDEHGIELLETVLREAPPKPTPLLSGWMGRSTAALALVGGTLVLLRHFYNRSTSSAIERLRAEAQHESEVFLEQHDQAVYDKEQRHARIEALRAQLTDYAGVPQYQTLDSSPAPMLAFLGDPGGTSGGEVEDNLTVQQLEAELQAISPDRLQLLNQQAFINTQAHREALAFLHGTEVRRVALQLKSKSLVHRESQAAATQRQINALVSTLRLTQGSQEAKMRESNELLRTTIAELQQGPSLDAGRTMELLRQQQAAEAKQRALVEAIRLRKIQEEELRLEQVANAAANATLLTDLRETHAAQKKLIEAKQDGLHRIRKKLLEAHTSETVKEKEQDLFQAKQVEALLGLELLALKAREKRVEELGQAADADGRLLLLGDRRAVAPEAMEAALQRQHAAEAGLLQAEDALRISVDQQASARAALLHAQGAIVQPEQQLQALNIDAVTPKEIKRQAQKMLATVQRQQRLLEDAVNERAAAVVAAQVALVEHQASLDMAEARETALMAAKGYMEETTRLQDEHQVLRDQINQKNIDIDIKEDQNVQDAQTVEAQRIKLSAIKGKATKLKTEALDIRQAREKRLVDAQGGKGGEPLTLPQLEQQAQEQHAAALSNNFALKKQQEELDVAREAQLAQDAKMALLKEATEAADAILTLHTNLEQQLLEETTRATERKVEEKQIVDATVALENAAKQEDAHEAQGAQEQDKIDALKIAIGKASQQTDTDLSSSWESSRATITTLAGQVRIAITRQITASFTLLKLQELSRRLQGIAGGALPLGQLQPREILALLELGATEPTLRLASMPLIIRSYLPLLAFSQKDAYLDSVHIFQKIEKPVFFFKKDSVVILRLHIEGSDFHRVAVRYLKPCRTEMLGWGNQDAKWTQRVKIVHTEPCAPRGRQMELLPLVGAPATLVQMNEDYKFGPTILFLGDETILNQWQVLGQDDNMINRGAILSCAAGDNSWRISRSSQHHNSLLAENGDSFSRLSPRKIPSVQNILNSSSPAALQGDLATRNMEGLDGNYQRTLAPSEDSPEDSKQTLVLVNEIEYTVCDPKFEFKTIPRSNSAVAMDYNARTYARGLVWDRWYRTGLPLTQPNTHGVFHNYRELSYKNNLQLEKHGMVGQFISGAANSEQLLASYLVTQKLTYEEAIESSGINTENYKTAVDKLKQFRKLWKDSRVESEEQTELQQSLQEGLGVASFLPGSLEQIVPTVVLIDAIDDSLLTAWDDSPVS
jgi:hypothetical protein